MVSGLAHGVEQVDFLNVSDSYLVRMLQAKDPACPKRMEGLFWMHDNIVAEEMVTFCDSTWSEPTPPGLADLAHKPFAQQWTRDTTVFGEGLALYAPSDTMKWAVSKNGKWISMNARGFIYLPDPDEELRTPPSRKHPTGEPVPFDPTQDMVRVSVKEKYQLDDPIKDMDYQYRVRRVACEPPAPSNARRCTSVWPLRIAFASL